MIVRKRKINPTAKEIQISISFGSADVRRWMQEYASLICQRICYEPIEEAIERARKLPETEDTMRYFFEHRPSIFLNYESPYREQLSGWAFAQAVALGYLVPSAAREGEYLLTDKFFSLVK